MSTYINACLGNLKNKRLATLINQRNRILIRKLGFLVNEQRNGNIRLLTTRTFKHDSWKLQSNWFEEKYT